MALVLRFGFAAQVIAAFVIFVLGYIGLFTLLMIGFVAVRALYEGVKWIRAYAARRTVAKLAAPSEGGVAAARIPFLFTPAVILAGTKPQPAGAGFHSVLTRRRVAGNHSLHHPGGTLR